MLSNVNDLLSHCNEEILFHVRETEEGFAFWELGYFNNKITDSEITGEFCSRDGNNSWNAEAIDHWMPLPEVPKNE